MSQSTRQLPLFRRQALFWLALVAFGTISTKVKGFTNPSVPTTERTRQRLSETSLNAQRPFLKFNLDRNPTNAASSVPLTSLQQSSVTGEVVGTPTKERSLQRLQRLALLKNNLTTKASDKVPSYSKLFKFCATTVLIWLSEPLLSLVDTTVVGWTQGSQSVVQLAALGPATTLMDTLLYMTYFLALSTTNLLTQGLAQKDWRGLQRWTSYLLTVAVLVGGGVTALMWSPLGPALLKALAGSAATPQLLAYATQYTRIRAAVAPFSVLGMVAQSFCLANLQSKAPLMAVAAASVVNIAGDLLLAKHGVVGAALATAVAGLGSTAILLRAVRKQFVQWRQQEVDEWQAEQETKAIRQDLYADIDPETMVLLRSSSAGPTAAANGTEAFPLSTQAEETMTASATVEEPPPLPVIELDSSSEKSDQVNTAVVEETPPKAISFFSLPSRQSVFKLATISGPLCVNMWAKMASYAALTVKATSFGVVPLAAHNVLMRLFFFLGCFADAMGLSAQAFLPPCLYPLDKTCYRATLDRLRGLTAVLAVLMGQGALALVAWAGPYLARDGAMRAALSSQASLLGWALFLHPLVVLSEGTVIATRDFWNLMTSYAAALGVHCLTLGTASSFGGVWQALVVFQALRFLNLNLLRRKNPLRESETVAP